MKYDLSKSKNIILSEEQEKVIKNNSFPQYLDANAGSGKTQVLTCKIMNILKENKNISLTDFAIITFTKKSAEEIKRRLNKSIYFEWLCLEKKGDPDAKIFRKNVELCNMSQISTIHSLCESILRDYGMHIGVPNTFVVSSFINEQQKIIEDVVGEYKDNKLLLKVPQFKLVRLITEFIKICKNKGINLDEYTLDGLEQSTQKSDKYDLFKELFVKIYKTCMLRTSEYKFNHNIVTIDDLISCVNKLLNITYVCEKVSKKYKYIFLDELQDTSKEQFEIFIKLSKLGSNLFCVGDEKQSIYSFRGADIENVQKFRDVILSKTQGLGQKLVLNHRTDPKLLELVNNIFRKPFTYEENILGFPKACSVSNKNENLCSEHSKFYFNTPLEDIIEYIINNVKIGEKPATYRDIAILFRRNSDLDKASKELRERFIPIEVMGGKNFYKSRQVIDTYKIFNCILYKTKMTYEETFFTDYYLSFCELELEARWPDFCSELETVFRSGTIEDILEYIWEKSHIFKYYNIENNLQAIANLLKLKEVVRAPRDEQWVQPIEFLGYLDVMITSMKEESEGKIDYYKNKDDSGAVSLYTIHKAKGLEFPIVIMPKCDLPLKRFSFMPEMLFDGKKLGFRKDLFGKPVRSYDKDYFRLSKSKTLRIIEEEVRVMYVACTRAKNMLIFSCDGTMDNVLDNGTSWAKWILKSGMQNMWEQP